MPDPGSTLLYDAHGKPVRDLRADGMLNVLTGLGDPTRDRSMSTTVARRRSLNAAELDTIYEQKGLGAVVIDRPADDMIREGFEIEGLDDVDLEELESQLDDLEVAEHAADHERWGSLYGGALLGVAVDDGLDPIEPLDLNRIKSVRGFFVVDRHAVNPISTTGGPPEAYGLTYVDDLPIEGRTIHASRVLKFCGGKVTARRQRELHWWGVSVLDRIYDSLRRLWTAFGYAEAILHDLSIDVFTVSGLTEAFKSGREDRVRDRLRSMLLSKSVLRGVALDGGNTKTGRPAEQYYTQTRSVTGVDEIVNMVWTIFTAETQIPRSIMLGETPGGLSTGSNAGEHQAWAAVIKAKQKRRMSPRLSWMLEKIFAAKDSLTNGNVPPRWVYRYRDLLKRTAKDEAEERYLNAQADKIYAVDVGAASPADVRTTRFESKSTGQLDAVEEPELPPDAEDPIAEELRRAIETAPAGAPGDPAEPDVNPAETAMNGAQISSLVEIVQAVAEGTLPLDTAVGIIGAGFPTLRGRERSIIGSAAEAAAKREAERAAAPPPPTPPPPPSPDDEEDDDSAGPP